MKAIAVSEAAQASCVAPMRPAVLSSKLVEVPRNIAMTIFVTLGLLVAMSVSQFENFAVGSFRYWLVTMSALLLPLFDLPAIVKTLLGRAMVLLVFVLVAGTWHLFVGDTQAVLQLFLFVYVFTWVSTDRAALDVHDIARLYLLLLGCGVAVLIFTDENIYSLVPGRAESAVAAGRVSFFPNIAYTGVFSLAALLVLTKDRFLARAYSVVLAIAIYFLIFSFVRASFIAAVGYVVLRWWFSKYREPKPRRMFWTALVVAFGFNVAIAQSAGVLCLLQDNFLVSSLFLRGETGISLDRIAYQLYRPWLWDFQFKMFAASPAWMGWGTQDFPQMVLDQTPPLEAAASVSLPMRLLTAYGIPSILFVVYLIVRLWRLARRDDRWACACFPGLFILMMNWGSVFHPTDAMFVLLMLIVVRGAEGFVGGQLLLDRAPNPKEIVKNPFEESQVPATSTLSETRGHVEACASAMCESSDGCDGKR